MRSVLPLTALKVMRARVFSCDRLPTMWAGANLTSLVPPDIAVVLKVGVAPSGRLGGRIAQAKSEIVES